MKTIYTAIIGNYDDLKEPFVVTPGWRYICFTDQDLKSDVWEIVKVPVMECGAVKTARYYKIMFHKHIETEFSIWVDATFIINCDLNEWWTRFTAPFTTVKHPFDDCIYVDGRACLKNLSIAEVLKNQLECYRKLGVPKNNGLIASGILMRQRTISVLEFCKAWWREVESFSPRDQVAFGKVNHRLPGRHVSIQWDYTREEEFIHIPHLHKKWRIGKINEIMKKYGKTESSQA